TSGLGCRTETRLSITVPSMTLTAGTWYGARAATQPAKGRPCPLFLDFAVGASRLKPSTAAGSGKRSMSVTSKDSRSALIDHRMDITGTGTDQLGTAARAETAANGFCRRPPQPLGE